MQDKNSFDPWRPETELLTSIFHVEIKRGVSDAPSEVLGSRGLSSGDRIRQVVLKLWLMRFIISAQEKNGELLTSPKAFRATRFLCEAPYKSGLKGSMIQKLDEVGLRSDSSI